MSALPAWVMTLNVEGLIRSTMRRGADRATAEDLVQSVLLQALQREQPLDPKRAPGWFRVCLRNARVSLLRTSSRRHRKLQEAAPACPDDPGALERLIRAEERARVLSALPTDMSRVVALCLTEGLALDEAARRLGVSPRSTYKAIADARGLAGCLG